MSVSNKFSVVQDKKSGPAEKPDRKDQLMSAAAEIFTEKGYYDVKISDIVARAGVAQGTFYLYFQNKTDLCFQLISNCCQRVVTSLEENSRRISTASNLEEYREQDRQFLSELFTMLKNEQPVLSLILADGGVIDPSIDKMLVGLKETITEVVIKDLESGIAAGFLRSCNTPLVAEAIVGMVFHLAFECFVRDREICPTLDEMCEEIIKLQYDGIVER